MVEVDRKMCGKTHLKMDVKVSTELEGSSLTRREQSSWKGEQQCKNLNRWVLDSERERKTLKSLERESEREFYSAFLHFLM